MLRKFRLYFVINLLLFYNNKTLYLIYDTNSQSTEILKFFSSKEAEVDSSLCSSFVSISFYINISSDLLFSFENEEGFIVKVIDVLLRNLFLATISEKTLQTSSIKINKILSPSHFSEANAAVFSPFFSLNIWTRQGWHVNSNLPQIVKQVCTNDGGSEFQEFCLYQRTTTQVSPIGVLRLFSLTSR